MYSFSYANVGVLCTDANDLSVEIQPDTGYSGGRQPAHLRQVLRPWRAALDPLSAAALVDVRPAITGQATTMTVRAMADARPGSRRSFTEIDRVTRSRTAGRGRITG